MGPGRGAHPQGGSTIGIPSPPAIWHPDGDPGRRIVTPSIHHAERMQGFDADWTAPAERLSPRKGTRWRLVGNAVTVGVSEWVVSRLLSPGDVGAGFRELHRSDAWPHAACGSRGRRWAVDVSMWPLRQSYTHLTDLVELDTAQPLSRKGALGFYRRATQGRLRFADGFLDDVASHIDHAAAA